MTLNVAKTSSARLRQRQGARLMFVCCPSWIAQVFAVSFLAPIWRCFSHGTMASD